MMVTFLQIGLFFAITCHKAVDSFSIIPTTTRTTARGRINTRITNYPFFSSDNNNNNNDIAVDAEEEEEMSTMQHRRSFMKNLFLVTSSSILVNPKKAEALVKGNAPPPPKKKDAGEKKCTNVEECQEMAERLAAEQDEKARASAIPAQVAPGGTRYRDIEVASAGGGGRQVKMGDTVKLRYKVLKLGKRSYDGLSGEGTVVFSRGYGLEDDEKKENEKFFIYTVGSPYTIEALNDGILGMTINSTRRIAILPQKGWRKPSKECDGGPGGSGSGGELKTDYVVVPTATMVATEICFDKGKLPFPTTYAQERRMAQRFDQSLIVEVEVVDIA